jgi:hypothetical protein
LNFAKREIVLSIPQVDGLPLRNHIESIYNQNGKYPKGYESLECPSSLEYLWHDWNLLSSNVTETPNTFQEIWYFCQLFGIKYNQQEILLLRKLDLMLIQEMRNVNRN